MKSGTELSRELGRKVAPPKADTPRRGQPEPVDGVGAIDSRNGQPVTGPETKLRTHLLNREEFWKEERRLKTLEQIAAELEKQRRIDENKGDYEGRADDQPE